MVAIMSVSMAVFERSQNVVWRLVFFLAVLFALGGCGGSSSDRERTPDPTPVPPERGLTGEFITGQSETLASQDVGPQGGTLVVSRPGHPLDGLEVDIPEGAFDDTRQVTIASAEIFDHTFGTLINPVTPLIGITMGDGYANDIVTVRIPVPPAADVAHLPFYYDEVNSGLEGVPFIAAQADSVTIASRRFSRVGVVGLNLHEDWTLSRLLEISDTVESGFRPGVNDFQFRNNGSHITPAGHFWGQVSSAHVYYESTILPSTGYMHGFPALWGLFDNNRIFTDAPPTPDFDWDDSVALRWVASAQYDYLEGVNLDQHWMMRRLVEDRKDELHFLSIILWMHVSHYKLPQVIAMIGEQGVQITTAYKVEARRDHRNVLTDFYIYTEVS